MNTFCNMSVLSAPKISVIVPVFNVEKYIKRCVNSILEQTFVDFEILLVNDGSRDLSGCICEEFAELDSRIRVFHKENAGVSSARNLGLDNARGEWIYFVDSDDILFSDCLQTLYNHTEDTYDCITGGFVDIYDGKEIFNKEIVKEDIWHYKTALLDFYRPKFFRFNGYLWNRMFRNSVIQTYNLRFHEDIFYKEDGLFVVEFICKSQKDVFVTAKPVYKYFRNPLGAMQAMRTQFKISYITNLDARILCYKNIYRVTKWYDFKLRFYSKYRIAEFYYELLNYLKTHKKESVLPPRRLHDKIKDFVSVPFLCFYQMLKRFK